MALPMHHSSSAPAFREPVARFFGVAPVPVEEGMAAPEPIDERPALRVIPGGRDAALRQRQRPEVYHQRRVTVLVVLSLVLVLAAAALDGRLELGPAPASPAARVDAGADAAPALPDPVAPQVGAPRSSTGGEAVYVVQPGDTLWDIARSLDADGDIRALVDELAERAGPGPLEAGARIDLTDLGA